MHETAANHLTFKELDERLGQSKGTAFKAFKRIEPTLLEGEDFWYYSRTDAPETIDELTTSGRLYATSVNAVILSPKIVERITRMLKNI